MKHLLLEALLLLLTILIFVVSKKINSKITLVLFSPIIVTPLMLIIILECFHIPYGTYASGTQLLTYMLGPATVAFAVPMYKFQDLLKQHLKEMIISLSIGSFFAVITSILLALLFRLSKIMVISIIPRSVTTPIAMEYAKTLHGNPSLTAVFVMITGLSGVVLGPLLIRLLSLKSPIAKGLLMGMGAHGTGTSKAFELGELEGTFSSLAMIIGAFITFIWILLLPNLSFLM
ncbi:LrgB family protein [Laceyella putida]|uniref:LrgB family protein n=1 Tax=Laceyella putida TaxID=110101 RepID=A0ABW2RNL8_9BACL